MKTIDISVKAVSQKSAYQLFEDKWLGKKVDYDWSFGYQCFDLARQWLEQIWREQFGSTGSLGARILWIYPSKYSTIPFIKNALGNSPKQGDIVIWDMFTYGHIAICKKSDNNLFTVIEQNWATGKWSWLGDDAIRLKQYDYNKVLWRFSI